MGRLSRYGGRVLAPARFAMTLTVLLLLTAPVTAPAMQDPADHPSAPCSSTLATMPDKQLTLLLAVDPEPNDRSSYKTRLHAEVESSVLGALASELEQRFWHRSAQERAAAPPLESCAIVRFRVGRQGKITKINATDRTDDPTAWDMTRKSLLSLTRIALPADYPSDQAFVTAEVLMRAERPSELSLALNQRRAKGDF